MNVDKKNTMNNRFFYFIACLLMSIMLYAQDVEFVTYNENFSAEQISTGNFPMHSRGVNRSNNYGAQININYSSVVPDSLRQAIEVATQLWEDILPVEAHLTIDVKFAQNESDMSVVVPYISERRDTLYAISYYRTYMGPYGELYDGYVTFSNSVEWCSQDVQGNNTTNGCLSTAMLRAIARTLGFGTTVTKNNRGYFIFEEVQSGYTPFEYMIFNNFNAPLSGIPKQASKKNENIQLKNYYESSNGFWLKLDTKQYDLYAPKPFVKGKSLIFLDDPTCLMHYEMPTGSNYLNIDSKTLKILKAIGWNINVPSSVEVYCKDIPSSDAVTAYNPYLFEIDNDGANITPLRWEYQVKSANGVLQTVYQQSGNQTFSVTPSDYISASHVNSSGIIDAVVRLTYKANNEVKITSMSLKLDCAPIILSISDQTFHFERYETLYDYSFNVSYRGATSITIGVEQEYSSFYDIIHIHEPNLAHAFIQALSRGNMVWIDISVTNEYGTVTETIEIPCQTNVHNVYNSTTSSENLNLSSRDDDIDYIDIYSNNGSYIRRIKSISELLDIHSRTVLLQYYNQNHKLTKTRKVNLK